VNSASAYSLELPEAAPPDRQQKTMDDSQLVQRMLTGDERAFERFSDHYIPALYRFALSRLSYDRELAQDITQSTVCKAIAKLDSFRGDAALMTWLCACCRTEIAMHFRKESRQPRRVELTDSMTAAESPVRKRKPGGPEVRLLDKEKGVLVHMALELLPEHYRQVLSWKYFEELPVKEIATRLGVKPKAAESTLTRARQSFRTFHAQVLSSSSKGLGS
jgi:RNA polymerase sigma-70 factor (ECF subfamily)